MRDLRRSDQTAGPGGRVKALVQRVHADRSAGWVNDDVAANATALGARALQDTEQAAVLKKRRGFDRARAVVPQQTGVLAHENATSSIASQAIKGWDERTFY